MVTNVESNDPIMEMARRHFGVEYLFPYQRLVIGNIFEAATQNGDDLYHHQIVILPTGAGKSLCFQLPAFELPGLTVVLFPLLALISDQHRRMQSSGIEIATLTGSTPKEERKKIFQKARQGTIKVILSNPETITAESMLRDLSSVSCAHLVIDEAHCISEWGETFRPAYLNIGKLIDSCEFGAITAFTATASPQVLQKIQKYLFGDHPAHLIMGNPDRENIHYHIEPTICKIQSIVHLLAGNRDSSQASLARYGRPAIIFCGGRARAENIARTLRMRLSDDRIHFYHAGMEREEKQRIEEWFFTSNDGILCSTCAYGMGVDKQNIRAVIHYDLPASVESYLQEAGRGGRDRSVADAILLVDGQEGSESREWKDATAKERYLNMVAYTTHRGCLRKYLLSLLGVESEGCSGCDWCDGALPEAMREETAILQWLAKSPRRYEKSLAVQMLNGSRSQLSRHLVLHRKRGWGILRHWEVEDITTALDNLLARRRIAAPLLWSRRLTIAKSGKRASQSSPRAPTAHKK